MLIEGFICIFLPRPVLVLEKYLISTLYLHSSKTYHFAGATVQRDFFLDRIEIK